MDTGIYLTELRAFNQLRCRGLAQGSCLMNCYFMSLQSWWAGVSLSGSPPTRLLDLSSDRNKCIPVRPQPVCTGSLTRQPEGTEQTRASKFENKPTRGCGSCDILGLLSSKNGSFKKNKLRFLRLVGREQGRLLPRAD